MATRRKMISNFKEGLQQLSHTASFEEMREIMKEMVAVCPPQEAHLCKPRIAAVMRQKHFSEMRGVKGHPTAMQDIDTKYRNLAMVLKSLNPGGMRGVTAQTPPAFASNQARPANLPQSPTFEKKSLAKKPSAFGLAGTLAKTWFGARKKQLGVLAGAVAGLGGLVWAYNKFYGEEKKKETRKNPDDNANLRNKQLESFEKTMLQMQKFRALTEMSRNPEAGLAEYKSLISLDPKKTKKKVKSRSKKEEEEGVDWSSIDNSSKKDFEQAMKSISHKNPKDIEIPMLTVSDFGGDQKSNASKSKPSRRKAYKKRSKNPEPEVSSEPKTVTPKPKAIEVEANPSKPPKTRKRKARKPRANKPSQETTPNVGPSPRLVPVVKRTKRVPKIRK